jgi:hypothetical protein
MIRNIIDVDYSEWKPVIYFQILDAFQYRCQTVISSDTLRHTVRNMPGVKTVTGVPMETERAAVDPAEIHHWFADLTRAIESVPREFFLNVDETGALNIQMHMKSRLWSQTVIQMIPSRCM